jgi:putative DNA primase/helicase
MPDKDWNNAYLAGSNAREAADAEWVSKQVDSRLRPLDIYELLKRQISERQMILDPVIPEKGLAMLYASRGIGKTHLACGISYAVSTGTGFLKWGAHKPRKVLHCDGELPAVELRERFSQVMAGASVQPEHGFLNILTADLIESGIGNLASPKVQFELEPWLEGVELLTLDNLSSLTAVIRDNDAESWNPIQEWLLRLRRRGVSVLLIHHAGKGGEQRGTSRREDVLDTSISLRRPSDYVPPEGARFEVHFEKARGIHGDRAKPFEARLEIRDGAMLWTISEIEDVNRARVKALLDDGMSIRDIADETGISKSAVHRLKKQIEGGIGTDMGQPPSLVSHRNGSANCPRPAGTSGTPESQGNQGFSATVPLSQPLGARDMGHSDGDPFASFKDEALIPDLPPFLDRRARP